MIDKRRELIIIVGIAQDEFSNELGTFIPNTLAISVGIMSIIEIRVNCFITTFRLFDITDAKASIMLSKLFGPDTEDGILTIYGTIAYC